MDSKNASCCHATFSRELLGVMGFPEERIPLFRDNQGTFRATSHVGFRRRTEHVDIKLECACESWNEV